MTIYNERYSALSKKLIQLEAITNIKINRREKQKTEYIDVKNKLKKKEKEKNDLYKVLEIYKTVINNLRAETYSKISSIVNYGIKSVFNNKFEFKINISERSEKPICVFMIKTDKLPVFIKIDKNQTNHGDGLIEIIAFLLQVTIHTIYNSPPIIILDESFRRLQADRIESVAKLIKELSDKLKIQFICTTHDKRFAEFGDKIIKL